jgi:hypothetical protein
MVLGAIDEVAAYTRYARPVLVEGSPDCAMTF